VAVPETTALTSDVETAEYEINGSLFKFCP
jgi:hypothetical protein